MTDSMLAFVVTNDLVAHTRGRALPLSELSETAGVGWVPADLAINAFGHLIEPNPFGALGDLRLIPDMNTGIPLPLPSGTCRMFLADQTLPDGTAWECCPRSTLKGALRRLADDHGLSIMAAFEHEFTLLNQEGEPKGQGAFTLGGLIDGEPFGADARQALTAAGIKWENWLPEYGPGQFEVTVAPEPGLRAADTAVLTREVVRTVAKMNSQRATFAPLIHPDAVGNGVHVHLSLWREGSPVTHDSSGLAGLSDLAQSASAGILEHAAAMLMWTAPSHVSALRLAPHRWSAAGSFVGLHNREALLRVSAIPPGSDAALAYNIEYRAADATANPYLVLAVLVHAMCDGLDRNLPLDSVMTGHIDDEQFTRLPVDLAGAIEAFDRDATARVWFSSDLVDTALAVRRGEWEAVAELDVPARCLAYAERY
ncbi:MAG: glutamine synthetase family protein [Actinomycetota bacterium]|nr:glutamine synthetase family protein [Actinomycetota bacterium]